MALQLMSQRVGRIKVRLCCEIRSGAERHDGVVMNLSPNGLFVQTKAAILPSTQVEIKIPAANDRPEIILRTIVVRQHPMPDQSFAPISEGLGMRILEAPNAYYELGERDETAPPGGDAPLDETDTLTDPPLQRFRVRVVEKAGSAFRVVTVTSNSARAARKEIQDCLGPDWEVADVFSG